MPKYSVILPVRNGGNYVKDCVNSILAQSYADLNLLILDNCSTDGTTEWLKSLHDNRIQIFPAGKLLTIEENWSRIVGLSKAEFMTFIGHDDLMEPDFIAVMDELIGRHPRAGLYQAHFRLINENGKTIRYCKPMDEVQDVHTFLAFFLSGMSELSIGQFMRSADFDAAGGIPPYPNLLYADLELWVHLISKSYRATTSIECCAYRIHSNSTTNSSSHLKYYHAYLRLLGYFEALQARDDTFKEVFKKYALPFLQVYCKSMAHHILRIPKKERKDITVDSFLLKCKKNADILVPGNDYEPASIFNIKVAKEIDDSSFLHALFLGFKKLYSKPVLK